MKAIKHIVQFFMVISVCLVTFACVEPRIGTDGLPDEFDLVVGIAGSKEATERSTINDDADVIHVYAKVYDSSDNLLPTIADPVNGVTALTKIDGKWSATVRLAEPASGTITFEIWAIADSGIHLYEGESDHVVGTYGNSVTVTTHAVYTVGSAGPAGGLIFYDKGSYSSGWRFLEAAPYGWYSGGADPYACFGYYRETSGGSNLPVGTVEGIGTGEANTTLLVNAMKSEAYTGSTGTDTTSSYAAKLCENYSVTVGGTVYDDWFLPSSGSSDSSEIDLMYHNLKKIGLGGFSDDSYWSSREYGGGALLACYLNFMALFA